MKRARYQTRCVRCQKWINPGDLISWNRRAGGTYHATCPEPTLPIPNTVNHTHTAPTTAELVNEINSSTPQPTLPTPAPITTHTLENSVLIMLRNNDKIGAIKLVRQERNLPLKEAKDYVDNLQTRFNITLSNDPTAPRITTIQDEVTMESSPDLIKALETLSKYMSAPLDPKQVREISREEVCKRLDEVNFEKRVAEAIANSAPVRIEVTRDSKPIGTVENGHVMMGKLLYLLSKQHHVYLYGPPGSGKSTAARMASEALGVQYGYISLNPQTPDSRLMGYMDATGNYRETLFYKLYKDGGVFCIDEMDNSSASLLTTLNSCLENGHASFPCGMVPRHENFIVVATGNTVGRGANPMFPDRRPFDAAFSERFTFLEWNYDLRLEESITLSINPDAKAWLNWVRSVRSYAITNHPKLIVSPRASFRGAEYLKDSNWKLSEIAEAVLFKGIDADTREAIMTACPLDGSKL